MAASLTYKSAQRQIQQGKLVPVYYLTGAENVLKDELISLIVGHVLDPTTRDFNLDVRSAGDLDGEALHALVETPPMLAERRVVVVRNIDQWRANAKVWQVLERYVTSPSPTTVLVVVENPAEESGRAKAGTAALKLATHVTCDTPSHDECVEWVRKHAAQAGIVLQPEAVEHLIEAVGEDLAQLGMEINKLAAAAAGSTVDAQQVAELVGIRRGETVADWTAAVLRGEQLRALEMLGTVLGSAGVSAVALVAAAGGALIGVRLARVLLDSGLPPTRVKDAVFRQISSNPPPRIGPWGAAAQSWVDAARLWGPADIDRAIRTVYETDRALKSTTLGDEAAILTTMLLSLSARKAAA